MPEQDDRLPRSNRHLLVAFFLVGLLWGGFRLLWGGSWNGLPVVLVLAIVWSLHRSRPPLRSPSNAKLFVGLLVTATVVAWVVSWGLGRFIVSQAEISSDPVMLHAATSSWYDRFGYLPGNEGHLEERPEAKLDQHLQRHEVEVWILSYTHRATQGQKRKLMQWYVRQPGAQTNRALRSGRGPNLYDLLGLIAIGWVGFKVLGKTSESREARDSEGSIQWDP